MPTQLPESPEKKPRLVKLAKAAMIVSGNGHRGFVQADSLEAFDRLPSDFLQLCPPGNVSLVMTNPPWAGLVNGRIADSTVLEQFDVAHKWEFRHGEYVPGKALAGSGIPPEYLFVERCIQWLRPGGRLAIVLPKGILDNMEPALSVRHFLFRHCKVLAVINCHKNTFQPYTGSRGCLILAEKHTDTAPRTERNYRIFMAINRKIGQDSEGATIYKKDDRGKSTDEIDHDLDQVFDAWRDFKQGKLVDSEYTFSISAKDLDATTLKLNPQYFLPSLNETLKRIVRLDGNGYSVERLGDRVGTRIWKGARFKREDLETDIRSATTVEYYTPSSIFMRGEGIKLLDLAKCPKARSKVILAHRATEGEILITRSGTIGRVTMVGRSLAGVVLSDDLIRVWIEDVKLRAFVFAFIRSPAGQDQLKRNEYGTVQQHLEPSHVADLLLPLPDDSESMAKLMKTVVDALESRERSIEMEEKADRSMLSILQWEQTESPEASA